ncbi:MAG: DUF3301 domain-containing protein [Pseudomonadota bacterium]
MDIIILLLIAAAGWFWWSSAQSRETAVALARRACAQCQVQLLDETVTLTKLRLKRNDAGAMQIARWYRFEFSTSGDNRRDAVVGLLGKKLLSMHLDVNQEELQH